MSSPNLDLVRSLYAAWERGDYFSSAEWADPEIEFVVRDGLSATTWTGLVGMAEGWGSLLSAWEGHRVEAEEYRELDDERILVLERTQHRAGAGANSDPVPRPQRQGHEARRLRRPRARPRRPRHRSRVRLATMSVHV